MAPALGSLPSVSEAITRATRTIVALLMEGYQMTITQPRAIVSRAGLNVDAPELFGHKNANFVDEF